MYVLLTYMALEGSYLSLVDNREVNTHMNIVPDLNWLEVNGWILNEMVQDTELLW